MTENEIATIIVDTAISTPISVRACSRESTNGSWKLSS